MVMLSAIVSYLLMIEIELNSFVWGKEWKDACLRNFALYDAYCVINCCE